METIVIAGNDPDCDPSRPGAQLQAHVKRPGGVQNRSLMSELRYSEAGKMVEGVHRLSSFEAKPTRNVSPSKPSLIGSIFEFREGKRQGDLRLKECANLAETRR